MEGSRSQLPFRQEATRCHERDKHPLHLAASQYHCLFQSLYGQEYTAHRDGVL